MELGYQYSEDKGKAATGPAEPVAPPEITYQTSGNAPEIDLKAPKYNKALADKRRNQFLTTKHSIKEKMQLYSCSTKGKLEELQEILEGTNGKEALSVTEEVSKAGYYWTVIHYASHYGHYEVLQYIIEFLDDHPDKFEIFNMQTTEGKSPLFCAILSSDINYK